MTTLPPATPSPRDDTYIAQEVRGIVSAARRDIEQRTAAEGRGDGWTDWDDHGYRHRRVGDDLETQYDRWTVCPHAPGRGGRR